MLTFLFLFIAIAIVLYQRLREGRWINLLSLLMGPYIVIVLFNNLLVYKLGFYKISDEVLLMLSSAFIVFFIGTLPFKFKIYNFTENKNIENLSRYNIKAIRIFLYVVGILGILQIILLYRQGLIFSAGIDDEGVMGNGPIGHLLLASYSVLPIYFFYWTYHKKIVDLIPVIMVLIVAFSSMIKYNVLGPIISIFIFVCLYRKSLLKKSIVIFSSFLVLFFVANYALGFAIAGVDVDPTFYLGHFWAYFAGSLIDDNYIFTTGINASVSIFDKIMIFLMALPNMFIKVIDGSSYYSYSILEWKDYPISNFGESSNVIDVIGFLYPSFGDLGDIICFLIVIFLLSLLISYIYIKFCSQRNKYSTFITAFLTYFIFLDFYSPFFVLPGPWEILIWTLIIPKFFKYHTTHNETDRIQCL